MKKIEITLQTEKEKFIIENIEPISPRNMLLKNLKNTVKSEKK